MHIAAQLPEPWVVRHTFHGTFFLKFVGNKNPFATWKRIWNQDGNWAFFVACCLFSSHQNSWREHHHFFPQKVQSSQHFWPLQCAVYVPGQLSSGFPAVFPFTISKRQEGSSSSVRAVKVIECNVRASRTVQPNGELKAVKTKSGWKKRVVKMLEMSNFIQSSGSATLASCFFFKFVLMFSISNLLRSGSSFAKISTFQVPFVSKTLNVNFIELATRVMLKQDRKMPYPPIVPYPSASGDWMLMLLRS